MIRYDSDNNPYEDGYTDPGTSTPTPNPYDDPYGQNDRPSVPPPVTPPLTPPVTPNPNPTPSDPWDVAPTNGDWQGWFLQNVSGLPANGSTLSSLEPKLAKHGITVMRNASGVAGKLRLPTGQVVDVGRSFSSGNPSAMGWQWDASSGGASGPVDLNAVSIDPSYLAPFAERAPSQGRVPTFTPPADFVSPGNFEAPTAETILRDPSYQFRVDQGRGQIENAAAARGTLNSGGNLHDILNYGQKAASQEYAQVFDRQFGLWDRNYQNALSLWSQKWNNAGTQFNADSSSSNDMYQRAWQQYVDKKDTFYRNQNEPFTKLYQAASLGAAAAR